MCQFYESERNFIVNGEKRASKLGFIAAIKGISKNPYDGAFDMYNRKARDHGFSCFSSRILPWSIESEAHQNKKDFKGANEARNLFKESGDLTDKILEMLNISRNEFEKLTK